MLTVVAHWQHGCRGIVAPHRQRCGRAQVFSDHVITLCLAMVCAWRDPLAQRHNPRPLIALTLATSSFGPQLYLLTWQPRG